MKMLVKKVLAVSPSLLENGPSVALEKSYATMKPVTVGKGRHIKPRNRISRISTHPNWCITASKGARPLSSFVPTGSNISR